MRDDSRVVAAVPWRLREGPECAASTLVFDKTFHDAGIVSAVQDTVNTRVPFADLNFTLNARGLCTAIGFSPINFYELSFQRFVVTIQVASVNTWCPSCPSCPSCPWWDIRTLGVPAVGRFGGSPNVLLAIAQLTHVPPPPPGNTYGT